MNLTKRPDGLPMINFHCAVCDGPIDGYTVSDIANPDHKMTFNAYCHGTGIRIGVENPEGFWETMAAHRGDGAEGFVLFRPDVPLPAPEPTRRDGRPLDPPHAEATELAAPVTPTMTVSQARDAGFTGNSCNDCGSLQMVRNGTCEKCNSCGATTGCS